MIEKFIELANEKIITLKAKQRTNNEKREDLETDVCIPTGAFVILQDRCVHSVLFLLGSLSKNCSDEYTKSITT